MSENTKQKQEQRNELHKALWASADLLRGSADGWDFKAYVLSIMFYRYISEKTRNFINENQKKYQKETYDYANESKERADKIKEGVINYLGYFMYPDQLFVNVVKRAHDDPKLTETISNIFDDVEHTSFGRKSEENFKGLFSDFNISDNKLGTTVSEKNKRLADLMDLFNDASIGNINDHKIDTFGDAYEYLMKMYASNAGKSGGEYFTPQEVSELLMKICLQDKKDVNNVYDPTCGSGSLLLKAAKLLNGIKHVGTFYGQEMNVTTYNLCRMNMFLNNVPFEKFNIANGDTLINPAFREILTNKCEVVVSNPPYSVKWEGDKNENLINDPRFNVAGVLAPKSKADLAFILHALSYLKDDGTAAIVCFPGILYRAGAEETIRKYLVDNNKVHAIIALPSNLFFGTSIGTCIMVLKNQKPDQKVLFVDGTREFEKETNNNKLSETNIETIYNWYANRNVVQYRTALISNEEIAKNNYNLSVTSYVEIENTKEKIDIVALNKEIDEISAHTNELRQQIKQLIADLEKDKDLNH